MGIYLNPGNEKFAKEAANLNSSGKLITGLSDGLQKKINGYLERTVQNTESAFSSEACKDAKFYFAKDASKGFFVYISKDGSKPVEDSDGTAYSSVK